MDLSASPRGWENTSGRPMEYSGIDLSSRKSVAKTTDAHSAAYRTQEFQQREIDLSTRKIAKPDITNMPYDSRTVILRNSHTMVTDLSKKQIPYSGYEVPPSGAYHTPRIPIKDGHRLPNYTILPDPSKIATMRMAASPLKRPLDMVDGSQQQMLKRMRVESMALRGAIDKRTVPMAGTLGRGEVGPAIEEPVMMVRGEGSGSDCDAVNPGLGEAVEEKVMFFFGEGTGRECDTGNPGDETSSDNNESSESKNDGTTISPSKISPANIKDSSSGSPTRVNANYSASDATENCQSTISPRSRFKPTLGVQVIAKSGSGPAKKLSRWDVGRPGEKIEESESSIISSEGHISTADENIDVNEYQNTANRLIDEEARDAESKEETNKMVLEKKETDCTTSVVDNENVTVCSTSEIIKQSETGEIAASSSTKDQGPLTLSKSDEINPLTDSSPPRFFFGPNCVSYTSKANEAKSKQIASGSVTTLQSTDLTKKNNCFVKIADSYNSESSDASCENSIESRLKNVELEDKKTESAMIESTEVSGESSVVKDETDNAVVPESMDISISTIEKDETIAKPHELSESDVAMQSQNDTNKESESVLETIESSTALARIEESEKVIEEKASASISADQTAMEIDAQEPSDVQDNPIIPEIIPTSEIPGTDESKDGSAQDASDSNDAQSSPLLETPEDSSQTIETIEEKQQDPKQLELSSDVDEKTKQSTESEEDSISNSVEKNNVEKTNALCNEDAQDGFSKSSGIAEEIKDAIDSSSFIAETQEKSEMSVELPEDSSKDSVALSTTSLIANPSGDDSMTSDREIGETSSLLAGPSLNEESQRSLEETPSDMVAPSVIIDANISKSPERITVETPKASSSSRILDSMDAFTDDLSENQSSADQDSNEAMVIDDRTTDSNESTKDLTAEQTTVSEDPSLNFKDKVSAVLVERPQSELEATRSSESTKPVACEIPAEVESITQPEKSKESDDIKDLKSSDKIKELTSSDEVKEMMSSDEIKDLTSGDEVKELMSGDDIKGLTSSDEVKELMSSDEIKELTSGDEVKELMSSDEIKELTSGDEVKELMSSDEIKELTSGDEVKELMGSDEIKDSTSSDEVKELKSSDEIKDSKSGNEAEIEVPLDVKTDEKDETQISSTSANSSLQIQDTSVAGLQSSLVPNYDCSDDDDVSDDVFESSQQSQNIPEKRIESPLHDDEIKRLPENSEAETTKSNKEKDESEVVKILINEESKPTTTTTATLCENNLGFPEVEDDKLEIDLEISDKVVDKVDKIAVDVDKCAKDNKQSEEFIERSTAMSIDIREKPEETQKIEVSETVKETLTTANDTALSTEISHVIEQIDRKESETVPIISETPKAEFSAEEAPKSSNVEAENFAVEQVPVVLEISKPESIIDEAHVKSQMPSQIPDQSETEPLIAEEPKPSEVSVIPEVAEDSKPSEVSVIPEVAEDSKPFEVSVIPEVAEDSKPSEVPVILEVAEESKPSEVSVIPEVAEESKPSEVSVIPEIAEESKPSKVSVIPEAAEESKRSKVFVIPEAAEESKPSKVSVISEAAEESKPSKVSVIPEAAEESKPSKVSVIPGAAENLINPQITQKTSVINDLPASEISGPSKENLSPIKTFTNLEPSLTKPGANYPIEKVHESHSPIVATVAPVVEEIPLKSESKKEASKRLHAVSDADDFPPMKSKPSNTDFVKEVIDYRITDEKNITNAEVSAITPVVTLAPTTLQPEIVDIEKIKNHKFDEIRGGYEASAIQPQASIQQKNTEIQSVDVKCIDLESDDSMGIDNESMFDTPAGELDPLACTEEDLVKPSDLEAKPATRIGIRVKPVKDLVYEGWKLDSPETVQVPQVQAPVSRKRRNSANESNSEAGTAKQQDDDDGKERSVKRMKLRGKRSPDMALRKSIQKNRDETLSSEDEAAKPQKIAEVVDLTETTEDTAALEKARNDRKPRGRPRGKRRRGNRSAGRVTRAKVAEAAISAPETTKDSVDTPKVQEIAAVVPPVEAGQAESKKKRKKSKILFHTFAINFSMRIFKVHSLCDILLSSGGGFDFTKKNYKF